MSDSAPAVDAATASDNALTPIDPLPPADTEEPLSLSDAARLLGAAGRKPKEQTAEGADDATAEQPAEEAADAQPEADPVETAEATETEETPAVEPPRSWTKEAKDRWASLPRDTQEYLAQREQERDREVRRSQNEAAEQRKAIEAEREAVRQLKQQYETKLPSLTKTLEEALQQEFGDIRSLADVRKLQSEDPFRFQQWQLRQMELAAAQKEQSELDAQRTQELQSKWNDHVQSESKKFEESLSDKDRAKLKDLMADAPKFLEDRGFTPKELADLASGKERLSVYDHRIQSLILDGMKYRDLQKAPPKAVPKDVPPVTRPGAKQPSGAAKAQSIQALNARLNETGSQEDAFALWMASRKAS